MECDVFGPGELKTYRYVVILSRCRGKWLLSRYRRRETWETQGGKIEPGETPLAAARRELFEESGALAYSIGPVCDYRVKDGEAVSTGAVFFAEIETLGSLPESEMAQTALFDALPENLTYPAITPKLFAYFAAHFRITRGREQGGGA